MVSIDKALDPAPDALVLYARDHPEANGKAPNRGDIGYAISIPLDDGRVLYLYLGQQGFTAFREILAAMDKDTQEGQSPEE